MTLQTICRRVLDKFLVQFSLILFLIIASVRWRGHQNCRAVLAATCMNGLQRESAHSIDDLCYFLPAYHRPAFRRAAWGRASASCPACRRQRGSCRHSAWRSPGPQTGGARAPSCWGNGPVTPAESHPGGKKITVLIYLWALGVGRRFKLSQGKIT